MPFYNCTRKLNTWWRHMWHLHWRPRLEENQRGLNKRGDESWLVKWSLRTARSPCIEPQIRSKSVSPSIVISYQMYKLMLKLMEKIKGYRRAETMSERQSPQTPGLSVKWLCCGLLANERTEGPTDDTGGPPDADEPRGHSMRRRNVCVS